MGRFRALRSATDATVGSCRLPQKAGENFMADKNFCVLCAKAQKKSAPRFPIFPQISQNPALFRSMKMNNIQIFLKYFENGIVIKRKILYNTFVKSKNIVIYLKGQILWD